MNPQPSTENVMISQRDSDNDDTILIMTSPTFGNISTNPRQGDEGDGSMPADFVGEGTNDGKRLEPLAPVFSFVPIIEMLPGLVLKDQTYHVNGPLLENAIDGFTSFAQRVEELTLTDARRDQYHKVSLDIIMRLAMIQGVKPPGFLSFLKHLHLVNVDSQLAYLWFCITPSLESLEVSNIPPPSQATISAFFKELILKAPQLARIVLGPGQLSIEILESAVKFSHLLKLEIIDAVGSLDFSFLQEVSALPHLEIFTIDAKSSNYTCVPISTEHASHPNGPSSSATEGLGDTICQVNQLGDLNEQRKVPFSALTTLTVVAKAPLIYDLVHHLFPGGIKHVSLTLIHDSKAGSEGGGPVNSSVQKISAHTAWDGLKNNTKKNCIGSDLPLMEGSYRCRDCRVIKQRRLANETAEKKRRDVQEEEINKFTTVVDEIIENAQPLTIHISCQDESNIPSTSSVLPSVNLLKLLSCASLTRLEIGRWALPSIDTIFFDVTSLPMQHRMQTLLLPLEATSDSGIKLKTLQSISQHFPELCSLQCHFSLSALDLNSPESVESHGLAKLLVKGGPPISMEDKLVIVPYICFLFPHLEEIAVIGTENTDDWELIHKLFKMCQKVRGGPAGMRSQITM